MLAGTIRERKIKLHNNKMTSSGLPTDLQNDIALMERIASRKNDDFHQLYLDYGQRMYAYALRITGFPTLAEDVVQDSLLTVWNSARSYEGKSRLSAWLLGIIHHTAMKALRHSTIPIDNDMQSRLVEKSPSPEEQTQSNERSEMIQNYIQKLSPEHRAVLDLVFYQGMTMSEAADICGCPVGTIKSRLSYARAYLKSMLSGVEDVL
mgnify:CR=1 FL=1